MAIAAAIRLKPEAEDFRKVLIVTPCFSGLKGSCL
jgi:hypothetical protein